MRTNYILVVNLDAFFTHADPINYSDPTKIIANI